MKRVLTRLMSMLLIVIMISSINMYYVKATTGEVVYFPGALFDNAVAGHTTRFDASDTLVVTFFDSLEGYVEFTLQDVPEGDYDVFLTTKEFQTRGIFDVYINGQYVGESDQTGSGIVERNIASAHFNQGNNVIRFEVNENSPSTIGLYEGTYSQIRLVPEPEAETTYNIQVTEVEGVTVQATPSTGVEEGETVILSIDVTDSSKILSNVTTSPENITITRNHTFVMPAGNVTVQAVLEDKGELPEYISETATKIVATRDNYVIDIVKDGFKYQFEKDGEVIAPRHDESGIRFAQERSAYANVVSTKVVRADSDSLEMEVTTTDNTKAMVTMHFLEDAVKLDIMPYAIAESGEEEINNKWYSAAGEPAFFVGNDVYAGNYNVTVDQEFSSRDNKSGAGPVIGYTDANNFINVRAIYAQADANKIEFLVRKNGSYTKTALINTIGVGGNIRVEVNGNMVDVYMDDNYIGQYDHGAPITGKVGYRSYEVNTVLDNYEVSKGEGADKVVLFLEDFDDLDNVAFNVTARTWSGYGEAGDKFKIEARTKGLGDNNNAPVYGLGDNGGWGTNANIFGNTFDKISNTGHQKRFISTFTVFPSEKFAQVLFETRSKRAQFVSSTNMLGVNDSLEINGLYYFLGDDIPSIYEDYKNARIANGYLDSKPHYEMFGVGFEAYGALHWDADEAGVQRYIDRYLGKGYNITWGVIGSGFWKGQRRIANEGCTTSFGIWDNTVQPGRTDRLANPRFPYAPSLAEIIANPSIVKPNSSQDYFGRKNIKLLLGLRNGFKADPSVGGHFKVEHDGPYLQQGLDNDYFLRGDDGELILATGLFPNGAFYLLDSYNEAALNWYKSGTDLWQADGFKEDAMLEVYENNDAIWNNINERLTNNGDLMIVRNTAYSVPGDLIRINDTSHGNPSRVTVNQMAYAASGYGNVYPDIIGANYSPAISPKYNNFLTRNAIAAAVMPSLSLGRGAWDMNSESHEDAVFDALGWHSDYAPYIYDAVLDGYETGYPYAYTPLFIAYPDNATTYNRIDKGTGTFEWLLGESILAAPIFDNATSSISGNMATTRDIYLPEGKWMDYETGVVYEGDRELQDYSLPISKIPVFVGGKGILVSENWRGVERSAAKDLYAEIFSVTPEGTVYDFTYPNGESKSVITTNIPDGEWVSNQLVVTNVTDNVVINYTINSGNDSIKFLIQKGKNYQVTKNNE